MPVEKRRAVRMVPGAVLKGRVMELDVAMLAATADADEGTVHKLRTCARRVEAQMSLLAALAGGDRPLQLPVYADEAKAATKRLRTIRKAAGAVRDLDVQMDAIRADAPAKTDASAGAADDRVRRQAMELRRHLKDRRKGEAAGLRKVLRAEEVKLAVSLRSLEHVLKPAEQTPVSQAVLAERTEAWFARATRGVLHTRVRNGESVKSALQRSVRALSEDALHGIRKASKLCRYMAETAPEGSPARGLSERFEALQEAGGAWHDWLLLERLAAEFHGRNATLAARYGKHRDAALEAYHLKLVELFSSMAK